MRIVPNAKCQRVGYMLVHLVLFLRPAVSQPQTANTLSIYIGLTGRSRQYVLGN